MIELARRNGDLLAQLVRFGLTGGLATALNTGIYWIGSAWLALDPNVAWTLGFVVAVIVGYVVHSRWSFRGHGASGGHVAIGSRFFAVAVIGYAINSFWVWLFATQLAMPAWSPIPFTMFVTPLFVFTLNRNWVFGS